MNPARTGARVFESDWGSSESGLARSETGTLGGCGSWDALLYPSIHFSPLGGGRPLSPHTDTTRLRLRLHPRRFRCRTQLNPFLRGQAPKRTQIDSRLTPSASRTHQQWYAGISAADHSSGEQEIHLLACKSQQSQHTLHMRPLEERI